MVYIFKRSLAIVENELQEGKVEAERIVRSVYHRSRVWETQTRRIVAEMKITA